MANEIQPNLNQSNVRVADVDTTDKDITERTARVNLRRFLLEHSLLTIIFLLVTLGGTLFLSWFGARESDKWIEGLRYASTNKQFSSQIDLEEKKVQTYIDKIPKATSEEKDRLFKQLKDVEYRASSHINVAKAFYIWNYQSITIATFSSIITATSLLFLSKKGWDNANKYVVNVFIVSFCLTVVAGVSPTVFKHEENISNNTRTYLAYIALDNRINTYIATKQFLGLKLASTNANTSTTKSTDIKTASTSKSTDIKVVIHSVDDELATLNNIYVGFDATKIPNYRQLFNEVNQ